MEPKVSQTNDHWSVWEGLVCLIIHMGFVILCVYRMATDFCFVCSLDAVGSSQIFFPTQNLERAEWVDKESEAVLCSLQYNQYAGPQKQEVINGHNSTIVWQKIKVRDVFQ